MREFTVQKNDAGQRLDKFLSKALPSLPLSLLYKSIRLKKIKVNRRRADGKQMLAEGDTVQLFLAEEFFPKTGEEHATPFLPSSRIFPFFMRTITFCCCASVPAFACTRMPRVTKTA